MYHSHLINKFKVPYLGKISNKRRWDYEISEEKRYPKESLEASCICLDVYPVIQNE